MGNIRLPAPFLAFLVSILLLTLLSGTASAKLSDGVTLQWNNGLRIQDRSDDLLYYLRLRLGFQFRYTYLHFDDHILSNDEDWNNFMFRRLRLWFDGSFPNRDWKYFLQLQLEPAGSVNALDAWLQWQRFPWGRIQLGRMKIPYGLEFWQSGFALNGVERTIFSGETDVDGKAKDVFGNSLGRFWPGSNAIFPGSCQMVEGTLFPVGGMTLYRSQGVDINGDVRVPGFSDESRLEYWLGLFNGRDTQGFSNPTDQLLYSFRLAYEPCGPYNLTLQGDWAFSEEPVTAFLVSFYSYTDTAWKRYDFSQAQLVPTDEYDIWDLGYDLAAIFRYRGFSLDLEFAWERFHAQGDTLETDGTYDRLGGRVNIGYFFLIRRLEATFKFAYLERILNNTVLDSLFTGLGLVDTDQGMAVEKNLQQYTWGLNYYFHGNNQKFCLDYSLLVRDLASAVPGRPMDNQVDHRVRLMFQQLF